MFNFYIELPDTADTNNIVNEPSKDSFPYVVFGIPILIVIVVEILKYNFQQKPSNRQKGEFMLDLCVDTLTVGITIFASVYINVTDLSVLFWNIVSFAIAMFVVLTIRRIYINGEMSKITVRYLLVFFCVAITFIVMFFLFKSVY